MHLDALDDKATVMVKLTIPTQPGRYADVAADPRVLRVLALSFGYARDEACALLAKDSSMIASFSRALLEGLFDGQTDEQFTARLSTSIEQILATSPVTGASTLNRPRLKGPGRDSCGEANLSRWPPQKRMRQARFRRAAHLAEPEGPLILRALCVLNGVVDQGFLSFGQLRNTLLIVAPLALFAGGQTLCMLTGGIDLSVTMTATATAYVVGSRAAAGESTLTSMLLGFATALVIGLVNGVGIGVFRVNPLIMTLGMNGIIVGVLTVGSQSFLGGATLMPDLVRTLGSGTVLGPLPWNLLVLVVIGVALVLLLRRTGLGRLVYATGDNRTAARLAGVRVWRVELAVYVACALLAGVAGILVGGRSGAVDLQLANSYLLPSVAAAVIGGTSILGGVGGMGGTFLGALILTVLDTLLIRLSVTESLRQMLFGLILLALAWAYVAISRTRSVPR